MVDQYLVNGCMRCPYGGTPQCKVLPWVEALKTLRQIVLETGLNETLKWGVPVYTHQRKNIVTINALKASANIGFFKGALLSDPHKILSRQGKTHAARIIRFINVQQIMQYTAYLQAYIREAIAIEEQGQKLPMPINQEPLPEELLLALANDSTFSQAFFKLTPGRQRAYIIYFSQPKQSTSRNSRIEKYKPQILQGIGLHDQYKSPTK